jgi:predicted unusual protein kinase regulating ubiquinone biosynthesis (AarF/ABC1/UbiB family)
MSHILLQHFSIASDRDRILFIFRFGSLLACETFHADVHAGNLLVLRDGRVGFIDFGEYVSHSIATQS